MQTLGAAHPFFVRCLKPNTQKVKDRFDGAMVLNQLRYSGMLETVRIRRAGYPLRREFADFLFRYKVFCQGLGRGMPPPQQCAAVLGKFDAKRVDWQLGHTKVGLCHRCTAAWPTLTR